MEVPLTHGYWFVTAKNTRATGKKYVCHWLRQ